MGPAGGGGEEVTWKKCSWTEKLGVGVTARLQRELAGHYFLSTLERRKLSKSLKRADMYIIDLKLSY